MIYKNDMKFKSPCPRIKIYWNPAMPFHRHIVCGCFPTRTASRTVVTEIIWPPERKIFIPWTSLKSVAKHCFRSRKGRSLPSLFPRCHHLALCSPERDIARHHLRVDLLLSPASPDSLVAGGHQAGKPRPDTRRVLSVAGEANTCAQYTEWVLLVPTAGPWTRGLLCIANAVSDPAQAPVTGVVPYVAESEGRLALWFVLKGQGVSGSSLSPAKITQSLHPEIPASSGPWLLHSSVLTNSSLVLLGSLEQRGLLGTQRGPEEIVSENEGEG